MDVASEILDAIEIIVDQKIRENTAQIYPGVCKSVNGNTCVMSVNGKNNTVQFYGSIPTVGTIYRVFVPNGNMSMAFVITGNDERKGLYYSNPNLLDNSVFLPGCLVDQRQGRVVIPNTTYYSDNQLTTSAGTTSAYVTAYRYATGTANGVNYASFKLTDTDDAPTYYAAPENVVRGYTGAGYGPDRWFLSNADGSMLVEDTGVRLTVTNTCNFVQSLPLSLAGETITLSVLVEDVSGPAYLSIRADNFGWMEDGSRVAIQNGLTTLTFTVASSRKANKKVCISNIDDTSQVSVKIKAAKLELGSQQTLAHQDANGNWVLNDPPPDHELELWKCRQYFRVIQGATYLNGIRGYNTKTDIEVPIPGGPMRATPTPTLKGLSNIAATDGTSVVTVSSAKSATKDFFVLTADSDLSVRGPVAIYCNDTIWLDANL